MLRFLVNPSCNISWVGHEEVSCKSRSEICTEMYASIFRDLFHSVWMLMKFVGMTTCFGEH